MNTDGFSFLVHSHEPSLLIGNWYLLQPCDCFGISPKCGEGDERALRAV